MATCPGDRDAHSKIYFVKVFVIANTKSSTEKWINSWWYIHTKDYYAALKMNKLEPSIFIKEPMNIVIL